MDIETKNRHATAAGGFVTVGDQQFMAKPLNAQETASVAGEWNKILLSPLRSIAGDLEGLPPELQKAAVEAAVSLQASKKTQNLSEEDRLQAFIRIAMTPEGCRFFFWMACRKDHHDLTLARCKELITDANSASVLVELLEATGFAAIPKSPGGTGSTPEAPKASTGAT